MGRVSLAAKQKGTETVRVIRSDKDLAACRAVGRNESRSLAKVGGRVRCANEFVDRLVGEKILESWTAEGSVRHLGTSEVSHTFTDSGYVHRQRRAGLLGVVSIDRGILMGTHIRRTS